LVSYARKPDETISFPFLQVRFQYWLKELRRMVSVVNHQPEIKFADNLKMDEKQQHLPLVHCRECGSMGWGAIKKEEDSHLTTDLNEFYQVFFKHLPKIQFVFPLAENEKVDDPTDIGYVCPVCLKISAKKGSCTSCDNQTLIKCYLPRSISQTRNNRVVSHNDCPMCQTKNGLTILGSRAASLTSVVIDQIMASSFNDDKKLVAFSDSVQDAAHRAGFFSARTYRTNFRIALNAIIQSELTDIFFPELIEKFTNHWKHLMKEDDYVATFIAPNMEWLRDYEYLQQFGHLPNGSKLPNMVDKRIEWEILSEFGYRSRIGRTLEKSSSAVILFEAESLMQLMPQLLEELHNKIGYLKDLTIERLNQFIYGLLTHLKLNGAIYSNELKVFIESNGETFMLNKRLYLPGFTKKSKLPKFLTNNNTGIFETLLKTAPRAQTWHEHWLQKYFPLALGDAHSIYDVILKSLVSNQFLLEFEYRQHKIWGLNPKKLFITKKVKQYQCNMCSHAISIPEQDAEYWQSQECLRPSCNGKYIESSDVEMTYYKKLYQNGSINRIVAKEHTGLLDRDTRESIEKSFINNQHPWHPNLLSATPTLEMGIDIGDLSSVVLCSVPPSPANYVQRIGRAGRKDGNSFNLTIANGDPHDLFFF
jgi:DEAD/DEAH box helicase domain-containing protein